MTSRIASQGPRVVSPARAETTPPAPRAELRAQGAYLTDTSMGAAP
jgi:hypothetical protein